MRTILSRYPRNWRVRAAEVEATTMSYSISKIRMKTARNNQKQQQQRQKGGIIIILLDCLQHEHFSSHEWDDFSPLMPSHTIPSLSLFLSFSLFLTLFTPTNHITIRLRVVFPLRMPQLRSSYFSAGTYKTTQKAAITFHFLGAGKLLAFSFTTRTAILLLIYYFVIAIISTPRFYYNGQCSERLVNNNEQSNSFNVYLSKS